MLGGAVVDRGGSTPDARCRRAVALAPALRLAWESVGSPHVPRWVLLLLPLGACAPSRPAPASSVEIDIAGSSAVVSDESASGVRRHQLERAVRWGAVRRDFPDLLADVTFGTAYPELLDKVAAGTTVTAYFRGPGHDCWRAELERSLPADDAEPPLQVQIYSPVRVDRTGRWCRSRLSATVSGFLVFGGHDASECWGPGDVGMVAESAGGDSDVSSGVLTRVDEVGAFFHGREVRIETRCSTRQEVAPCRSGAGSRICKLCDLQPELAPGCTINTCGVRVMQIGRSPLTGSACPNECPYSPLSTPELDRLVDVAGQGILSVPREPSHRYALYWTEKACREASD